MPQVLIGDFPSALAGIYNATSDTLVIHSTCKTLLLNLSGDVEGSVKIQKSPDGGQTWVDQETYSIPQVNVSVNVAPNEYWRLMSVGLPDKQIHYKLSMEDNKV